MLRAIASEIERRDAEIERLRSEVERLRTVIRAGGAMLRAEVVALGGPIRVELQPCKAGCGELEDPRFGGFCDGCAP